MVIDDKGGEVMEKICQLWYVKDKEGEKKMDMDQEGARLKDQNSWTMRAHK